MNCGRSSSVEWKLPKLQRRVRFPSPAPPPPGSAPGDFVMPGYRVIPSAAGRGGQNSPNTSHIQHPTRQSSPNTAPPAVPPRKNLPSTPENSVIRPFWACRTNFFAHRTYTRGDFETNDTSATADAGHRETTITTARLRKRVVETDGTSARLPELTNETAITIASSQHPKNQHFPRAKVSPVSSLHSLGPAKVSPVSSRRSSALDTAPKHQIAQHCTGN